MFLVNLDRLIESQGMSKNEFSKKVGIAPSTISSWYNKGGLFKMIINKEQITIDKFEVRLYNKTYLILTYEKSKDGFTEFYITEKESCIVSFCIGCKYKEIIPRIESFIKRFIDEWVDDYNQEIDLLEDYTGA